MPVPNLIEPIRVTIEPLDSTVVVKDPDTREVMRGARGGTPFTIDAQIRWGMREEPTVVAAGVREAYDGYIVVRYVDMDALGVTIKRGDRITAMGRLTEQSLYILGNEPFGHYTDQNGPTLIQYNFSSRRPGREPS